jgi:two-component system response regulator
MMNDVVEILLVEDDPRDVQLTVRALQTENVSNQIEVARDGEEALDYLFCRGAYSGRSPTHRPKLILLDLKLPKVDGLQVLKEIKASPDLRDIPVVVLTSSGEQRDVVESYHLGVNSYIEKPVDIAQFRKTIKTAGMYWLVVNRPPPERPTAGGSQMAALPNEMRLTP